MREHPRHIPINIYSRRLSLVVAVAATISAAVTAYAAGSRYEYQLVEYLRTAAQLDRLRSGLAAGGHDAAAGDAFVRDCEQVVSAQNEAWMAKWTGDRVAETNPE